MSRYGLDNKSKKVGIVLNPEKGNKAFYVETLNALDAWLADAAEEYAYIIHDLDVTEDGEAKQTHIHLFVELKVCQRMYTTLNKLADALDFENEQISIEKCTDAPALIQYLIHKNNPEKHQYRADQIKTSLSEEDLKAILACDCEGLSLSRIVSICATSYNLVQVIEKIGLQRYQHWRNVVLDVWKDCHERKSER